MTDLKALENNIGNQMNSEQRLNEREMCALRLNQKESKTLTYTDIAKSRKREMVEENTKKFGEQTIGIHGQELPQYSHTDDSKKWWTYLPQGSPDV